MKSGSEINGAGEHLWMRICRAPKCVKAGPKAQKSSRQAFQRIRPEGTIFLLVLIKKENYLGNFMRRYETTEVLSKENHNAWVELYVLKMCPGKLCM